eukprot:gene21446-biopygen426
MIIAIIDLERGIPSKRESSARVDYVPALCTHRPSLLPIEWSSETFGLAPPRPATAEAESREVVQVRSFRGSKSRNKVSVGEPAEGSLPNVGSCVDRYHCELVPIRAAAWSDVQCADPHGPSLLGLALRSSHFSPERVNGCSVSSDKASGKVGGCSGTCCYSPTDDSSSDGAEESGTCSASAGLAPFPDVMSSTADCLQCVGTAWRHAGGLRTRCASVVGGHMASSDPS